MFDPWLIESLRWYLVLIIATWAIAPMTRWLFGGLSDKGATVGRPLALLLIVWPTWFLAGISPFPFTTTGLWITLAIAAALLWFFAWKRGWLERGWIRSLLIVEGLSALAFAGYVALRGYTPQIVWTEKAMDIAFLNGSMRADSMPPSDPWFAGEPINYYYLGYLLHAAVGRMADVPTWTGYNLALGATASMSIVAAGGVAFNVLRPSFSARASAIGAGLAGFLVVLSGNMHAPLEYLRDRTGSVEQGWWGSIGWSSSRIVVDTGSLQAETINEFPWFSLLLGDLHPHLMALPFTILALALGLNLYRETRDVRSPRQWLLVLILSGGLAGALYPLNSLDLPTYLVLLGGSLALAYGLNRRWLKDASVLALAALIAWLPFTVTFVPFSGADSRTLPEWMQYLPVVPRLFTTLGWHAREQTSAREFLTVFGLFWIVALAFIVLLLWRMSRRGHDFPEVPRWMIAAAGLAVGVAILVPAPVLVLAGGPVLVSLWFLIDLRDRLSSPTTIVLGLLAAAFGLVIITEFIYVQDAFAGRYNTLFKVYYQVWTLLAIAIGIGVVAIFKWLANFAMLRGVAMAAICAGLLAASAYPLVATTQWTRVHGERSWQGLDGAAFMAEHSSDDVAAMRWLYDNANSDDVIVEAPGCSYQVNGGIPTGRMAAFTGVPTIIGWGFHQVQWRGGQPELLAQITPRGADVATIYADQSADLLDAYGVTLLYVGSFERFGAGDACDIAGPFPAVVEPDFPGPGWTEVYSSGGSRIYRRIDA
ncbi:DUF2298 domain-containing protein [soil metagenome]